MRPRWYTSMVDGYTSNRTLTVDTRTSSFFLGSATESGTGREAHSAAAVLVTMQRRAALAGGLFGLGLLHTCLVHSTTQEMATIACERRSLVRMLRSRALCPGTLRLRGGEWSEERRWRA